MAQEGFETLTSARLKHHVMVPVRRKQLLWCAAEASTRRRRRSVIELLVCGDKSAMMCNMGHARAVLIMTRCAHRNELNTYTLRRATHNMSRVHTHWYVRTYDCCKHHTRRGLHKHAHSDVLYDKLHQHYILLRIRRHISLCSPILHVTAHQKTTRSSLPR